MVSILKFIYSKITNSILLLYFYLLILFYIFGYFILSFHYIVDINFILVGLLACFCNFLFVSYNLKSIIIDYINNEASQILLRSLLFLFLTNIIIYLVLSI